MTEAEIAELKRLKNAATLGPYWSADGRGLEAPAKCIDFAVCSRGTRREVARVWTEADTHYITALLTQADALLAAAEAEQALRTENERLREALSQIKGGSFDEAVRFALDGKWQEFAIKLQEIARAALSPTGGATCAMALEVVRLKNDRIDQKSAALARQDALLAEAREALRLLLHEVEQSGNATAKDYGWPSAVEACRTVIEKIRGVS